MMYRQSAARKEERLVTQSRDCSDQPSPVFSCLKEDYIIVIKTKGVRCLENWAFIKSILIVK
jgi:hypothetical protein